MRRGLSLVLTVIVLAGCSLTNPFVVTQDVRQGSRLTTAQGGRTEQPEFRAASDYAARVKQKYRDALGDQAKLQSWLGLGLIPLSAAAIGLGATGGPAQAVLGLGLGGAAGFGMSTWLLNKPRQVAYVAGIKAVTCAEDAVTPLALTQDELKDLDDNLIVLNAAIPPVQAHIAATARAVDLFGAELVNTFGQGDTGAFGEVARDARNEISAAKSLVTSAQSAYDSGVKLQRLAASVGRRLAIAVDKIVDTVDGIIVETQRDPQALITIINGLGGSYKTLSTVPEALKPPSAPAKAAGLAPEGRADLSEEDRKRFDQRYDALVNAVKDLRDRSAALSAAVTRVAAIVNAVGADAPLKALESCGVKSSDIVTALAVDPAGPFELEKPGGVGFVARGGLGPYWAVVKGPSTGVTLTQDPAPYGPAFTVIASKDAQSGTYVVTVLDNAAHTKQIQVVVRDAAAPTEEETKGETRAPPAPTGRNVTNFIAKVKQQEIVVPDSGVTLKIGDPTVEQGKIVVLADVQSVQKLRLDKLTQETVVKALQTKGLNSIKADQIVVDVASLKKAAARKGVPLPAPDCDAILLESSVPPKSEPLFPASKPEARKLQAALCLLDKPGQPDGIDGVWGRHTKRALKQYQCRTGRPADGKLTPALRDELLSYTPDDVKKLCGGR